MKSVTFNQFSSVISERINTPNLMDGDFKTFGQLLIDCNLMKVQRHVDFMRNQEIYFLITESFGSINKALTALLNSELIANPTTRAKLSHSNFLFI